MVTITGWGDLGVQGLGFRVMVAITEWGIHLTDTNNDGQQPHGAHHSHVTVSAWGNTNNKLPKSDHYMLGEDSLNLLAKLETFQH